MSPVALWRRLRALGRKTRDDRELEDEMRLHLQLRQERLEASGLSPDMATFRAQQRFGSLLRHREDGIDQWGWRWLEQLLQDLRFGVRTLRMHPGFATTVILTLALATGATTSIFSIVNGVLLRPLPFADPDRLVQVYGRAWQGDRGDPTPDPLTGPVGLAELQEYRAHSRTFDRLAGYYLGTRHLDGPSGPERLTAVLTDTEFFTVLGVQPVAGRTFTANDVSAVVVISGGLWQRRFNRDPGLIGRSLTLDGQTVTVVGVMPDGFQFPYRAASLMDGALPESRTDVWVLGEALRAASSTRTSVVARMKPGVTIGEALADLRPIAAGVEERRYRGTPFKIGVRLVSLNDEVMAPVRRSLWFLLAAVGLALAAAAANVANLLLARISRRSNELVTRAALGAGRLRLVRQFLAEGLVLALAGGVAGALVAAWGTTLLVSLGAAKIPRAHEVTLDWTVFAFLMIACAVMAVVFGAVCAHAAARADSAAAREVGRATGGPIYTRVRDALVVTEVALAFMLAIGAAVVVREADRLRRIPAGVTLENVLTVHLTPRTQAEDYYAIEGRVAAIPGVRAAGFTQLVPLQNWGWPADFSIRGRTVPGRPIAGLRFVTPGYFTALGIPTLRGRTFTDHDDLSAQRVIVINHALADRYFANEDPVGAALDRGLIVGVVGDVRQAGLDRPADPEIFYPAAQNVTMASDIGMALVVRTTGPPEPLIDAIRAAVRDVNPRLAVFNVKTMEQVMTDWMWEMNLYRWLIGLFAALAVTIAAIGLFGVMSYTVTARVREFAVRLALGSDPIGLCRIVLARGAWLAVIGLIVGIVTTWQLFAAMGSLPIGGRPDVSIYAAVSVMLLLITLIACVVPAVRVVTVNPVTALRQE